MYCQEFYKNKAQFKDTLRPNRTRRRTFYSFIYVFAFRLFCWRIRFSVSGLAGKNRRVCSFVFVDGENQPLQYYFVCHCHLSNTSIWFWHSENVTDGPREIQILKRRREFNFVLYVVLLVIFVILWKQPILLNKFQKWYYKYEKSSIVIPEK